MRRFTKSLNMTIPTKKPHIFKTIGPIFNKDIRQKVRNRDAFTRVQDYLINNFAAPTNLSALSRI